MKNNLSRVIRAAVLVGGTIFATLSSFAAEKPAFVLATNGIPQAVIVTAKDAPATVKESARMLADYLGRLSGATFMAVDKPIPGFKSILVGTPYTASKREELRIRVKDANTLEVTGDGQLGTRYAVQELIEHFGTVFCSAIYEYVPKYVGLSLPGDFDRVDAPFMEGRGLGPILVTGKGDYAMKLRLNIITADKRMAAYDAGTELRIGSNPYYKMFPEHHAFDRDGNRSNHCWFCPSDDALYPKLFAAIEKDILAGQKMISLGVDDGGYMCQ